MKSYDKLSFAYLLLAFELLIQVTFANNEVNSDIYDIGVGIADITGQAVDVTMVILILFHLFDLLGF
jgi:hypothetical protein